MSYKLKTWHFSLSMLLIFLLGVGYIAVIYFMVNPQITQSAILESLPVTQNPVSLTLNLTSPDDNLLVFTKDILIQGKTSTDAMVILNHNGIDEVLKVDHDGNFSVTEVLDVGVNLIDINVFDNLGNNKNESRTIFYSKEEI